MSQTREQAVLYWWNMAEESLLAAQREAEAEAFPFAINRIYYAIFYAVSAALLERNLSFAKHSGVRAAFHREFIKNGLLEVEWGKFYDQLFEDRQEGDYLTFVSFEQQYVGTLLIRCRQFLDHFRPLVSTLS